MHWGNVTSGGVTYSLTHLHPFTVPVPVGSRVISLHVTFGFHVFTDEKGNGKPLTHRGENRFFCKTRCLDSHQAVCFLQNQMATAFARPYTTKWGQQYFVMDITDYAIFLTLRKPQNTVNELKCHVVSAYSVDQWGKAGLPTWAKIRTMGYVLDRRERGEQIPT
ncbi:hypothetical protein WDL38_10315 [Xanthomonas arboricola pv. pruni]